MDRALRARTDLLFLQEVPPESHWPAELTDTYEVHRTTGPTYKPVSLVAVRKESGITSSTLRLPTDDYHGSYLAAATLTIPGWGDLWTISVHASPTRPTKAQLATWPGSVNMPRPRGVDGSPDRWDSDLVLATIGAAALENETLAVGDFNEARNWDHDHHGAWGGLYFDRASALGLRSPLFDLWTEEQVTSHGYQLDHILATDRVAAIIGNAQVQAMTGSNDHAPIAFTIECGSGKS